MSDFDAWLDDYQPMVTSEKVCGRADLVAEHARLDLELSRAQTEAGDVMHAPAVTEAKQAVRDLEAQIEAAQREFKFQGIGHLPWQDLKKKCPPTEQDRQNGLEMNMERFAPEAMAASSIDPELTVDQCTRLLRKLPPGEFERLFDKVLEANGKVIGTPKSVLAALIERLPQNGASSTTSLPEESPEPSDSDVLADLEPPTTTPTEESSSDPKPSTNRSGH